MTVPFFTFCPASTFISTNGPETLNASLLYSSACTTPVYIFCIAPSDSTFTTRTGRILSWPVFSFFPPQETPIQAHKPDKINNLNFMILDLFSFFLNSFTKTPLFYQKISQTLPY